MEVCMFIGGLSRCFNPLYLCRMISFFSEVDNFDVNEIKSIIPVLKRIIKDHKRRLQSANIIFVDDETLLEINRKYLKHDYYTDIITFNYAEEETEVDAELYISLDRVAENARDLKVDFLEELEGVVIHGFLHLAGYNDQTKSEKEIMRRLENQYIKLI